MLAAIACGVFVTVAEPVTVPLLRRLAAIDMPNQRSSHTVPTPRGGGAPVAIGLVIAALLIHSTITLTFGATVGVFAAIGLADDLSSRTALGRRSSRRGGSRGSRRISPGATAGRRLAMQAAASLPIGWLLANHTGFPAAAAMVTAVILAVWLTGFVNVFNFMDGVNGISAVHALLGGVFYASLGFWRPDGLLAVGGAAVAAGALAFLPWNAGHARVFLGDVGSYALGAALALLAAYAVIRGLPPEAALGPLALYLADTAWTLQRRIRAGEPWLQAHRTHTYQRLCDSGWSHSRVTVVTGAVTAAVSLLGAASLISRPGLRATADLAAIALLAVYLRFPVLLGSPAARHRVGVVPSASAGRDVSERSLTQVQLGPDGGPVLESGA